MLVLNRENLGSFRTYVINLRSGEIVRPFKIFRRKLLEMTSEFLEFILHYSSTPYSLTMLSLDLTEQNPQVSA